MMHGRRVLSLFAGAFVLAWLHPAAAYACSAPFEEPTIRALGPAQVVVVGTIGERVAGGRAFHVERWFNGGVPSTPIIIAFKEGEPIGDCSYLVRSGQSLIIAPNREANGALSADLVTLQADPSSDLGRKYVAEATQMFGPGVVPQPAPGAAISGPAPDVGMVVAALGFTVALLFTVVVLLARRQRRRV